MCCQHKGNWLDLFWWGGEKNPERLFTARRVPIESPAHITPAGKCKRGVLLLHRLRVCAIRHRLLCCRATVISDPLFSVCQFICRRDVMECYII